MTEPNAVPVFSGLDSKYTFTTYIKDLDKPVWLFGIVIII